MLKLKKYIARFAATVIVLLLLQPAQAQTGSFNATFTPSLSYIKPVTIAITKPMFKFDNTHGYWFINPHNNYKHFNTQPDEGYADRKEQITSGIAFIMLNLNETDADVYSSNDSIAISLQRGDNVLSAPEYDPKLGNNNKPLHVHINSISASEISFTLSGNAKLVSAKGSDQKGSTGIITATGHFYREAKYIKSDMMPGCSDCDPNIYAKVYDEENNIRTASGCENAMAIKVFDAIQKTLSPIFSTVGFNGSGKMAAGDINVTILSGHTNINVQAIERDYCATDFNHMRLTSLKAEKTFYSNEDGYGLRLIKMPTDRQLNSGGDKATADAYMKNTMAKAKEMQDLLKQYTDKKISLEEYQKKAKALTDETSAAAPKQDNDAFEKAKIETDLTIKIILNPGNTEVTLLKMCDKNKTEVTHTIKGAAFEIYSPSIKDSDGTYLPNRKFIYFGKFTPPVTGKSGGGFDAKTTKAIYPPNGNKLSVYNIIIKLEGSQDMMDKAIAAIDFDTLQNLITKQ